MRLQVIHPSSTECASLPTRYNDRNASNKLASISTTATSCLEALQMGDILVTWQLDGLGRDRTALLDVLRELVARQIGLKILDEPASMINTAHISLTVWFYPIWPI